MNTLIIASADTTPSRNRWLQLVLGIICMAMVANLKYGWTLFVNRMDAKYQRGRADTR